MLSRPFSFGLFAAGFCLILGAAGSPPSPGSYLRIEDHRVAAVGHRIAIGAAAYCPEPIPISGLQLDHIAEYAALDRPELVQRRQLDRGPGVLSVIENSPAAKAGLMAGDILLSVNARAAFVSPELPSETAREQTRRLLERELRLGPARLLILRSGRQVSASLSAQPGCPVRVRLARSEDARAVAGGGNIVLTDAALAEMRSDDELAVILSHELAHVVLKHGERLRAQGVPRGALRGFGRNAARVLDTEKEADRLGIKMAWAAGYDVNAAIPFWRRFYAKYDGPRLFRTHPALPERERLIREAIAELQTSAERPEFGKSAPRQR